MEKIAVAVRDNGNKVGHFGKSENFIIYNYDKKTGKIEFNDVVISLKNRKDEEEWEKSADDIQGCSYLICERIGVVPKVQLKERNMKVIEDSGTIEEVLDNFIEKQKQ